jgi:hypothetical protein
MSVTTEVRVRYAETDQMGVVYYANYLVWFEVGRVEVLRTLGLSYRRLETEHQCILPVVEVRCRYRSPARYDVRLPDLPRSKPRGKRARAFGRGRNGACGLRWADEQNAPAGKVRCGAAVDDGRQLAKQ